MNKHLCSIRQLLALESSGYWGLKPDEDGVQVAVVRNGDISEGSFVTEHLPQRTFAQEQVRKARLMPGDILLTSSGNTGRTALVKQSETPSGLTIVASNFVRILRPDARQVVPAYLSYGLQSAVFIRLAEQYSRGATIKNLSSKILDVPFLPVPSIAEQEDVVNLLAEADELKKLRAQSDNQTSMLMPALFHEMFGDLRANEKGWPPGKLEDLCSNVVDCPHSTPVYASGQTHHPCVRSSDIQNSRLDWSSTKYVGEEEYLRRIKKFVPLRNDVIFCREGARLGNSAQITDDTLLCLGQRMMLFRTSPQESTPEFLWAVLQSELIQEQVASLVGGSASPHLNVRDIKNFNCVIPPLSFQKKFSMCMEELRQIEAD